ncbi:MAG: family 16 glycoside hydrolase [Verrucomicrobiota bacterium]
MNKVFLTAILALSGWPLCGMAEENNGEGAPEKGVAKEWKPLFDGKSLTNWAIIDYPGHAKAAVEDGELIIEKGVQLSGVRYTGDDFPEINYELEVVARKIDGYDFFAGITFPYKDTHATWVLGGWGGSVVGISSINDEDAYENETMEVRDFDFDKYYTLRLQVTEKRFLGFIDEDDRVVNVNVEDKRVSMRWGSIEDSVPLGISTFMVKSGVKSVRIRKLNEEEIATIKKMDDDLPF